MFESLVTKKTKVVPVVSKIISPPKTPTEKRRQRLELATESLVGDLFKSGTTKQKERVEKALATINEIKKKNSENHIENVESCTEHFSKYSRGMTEVASHVKNKKFDINSYKKFIVPEGTIYFHILKGDMDNHAKVRSLVEKLFTDSDIDAALKALDNAPAYMWYEEAGDDEYVPEDRDTLASAAGYSSDFISYALSTVSIAKQAIDAMISLSARTGALIEKQKTSITATISPVELDKVIQRCRKISTEINYATHATADEHCFGEFLSMAELFSKECYK
jgi:hypothetical protein